AGADAGIPAVAAGIASTAHTQLLADGVVVVGGVVGRAEVAAAHAHVPGRVDVHARIGARDPAAQRVARLGLVHFTVVEEVAHAEVAEVDVAEFGAHAPTIADLPAIPARSAVAGLAALVAFEEIEVAGAETAGRAAIGAADVTGHEPRTIANGQAGAIGITKIGR